MKLIEDRNVIDIVRSMLNLLDHRLVDHGERVTYLCVKIMEELMYSASEIDTGAKLALFHDIGAYKTDEIDAMLSFESEDVWEHAVYGYLFLSRMTPLHAHAECILFHHVGYEKLKEMKFVDIKLASLVHLCDRIDVLLRQSVVPDANFFARQKGLFHPEQVAAYLKLNAHGELSNALLDGTYHKDMDTLFNSFTFSEEEKDQYLCMLAYSIDFNSEFTVLHTIMTTSLAEEIARFCDLPDEEVNKIYYGALLHDIGKAAIPISILEKPGKLSEEETAIMKSHVLAGERVLKGYLPEEVLHIALHHHEKLDGSGYPYGLTENQMTLSDCVVAVADILSALLGRRSYKEPLSVEKSIAIIERMAQQGELSKEVVQVFHDHHEQILNNTYRNSRQLNELYKSMREEYQAIYGKLQTLGLLDEKSVV